MGSPTESVQVGLYDRLGNQNTYVMVPGTCVLPVAEEPPTDPTALAAWSPVVVFHLHAPYRIRKLSNLAEKKNNPPVVPAPGNTGSFVFLGGSLTVVPVVNNTFSNYDWVVQSEYAYVENCVSRVEDGFVLGGLPYQAATTPINLEQYGGTPPQIGAVAHAGVEATIGYNQGRVIVTQSSSGALNTVWGYNSPAFFPGTLLSTDLANGGEPVVPVTT